jgi:NADH-quinone oxidoreductase subunit M
MIVTFSSIGLPGTNGFVGEFLVLIGAFESSLRWYAVIASSGVILSAVYMLWMFQRVMFGKLDNPKNQKLEDLNSREIALMLPLVFLIFYMGLNPSPFTRTMAPALDKVIQQSRLSKPITAVQSRQVILQCQGMSRLDTRQYLPGTEISDYYPLKRYRRK